MLALFNEALKSLPLNQKHYDLLIKNSDLLKQDPVGLDPLMILFLNYKGNIFTKEQTSTLIKNSNLKNSEFKNPLITAQSLYFINHDNLSHLINIEDVIFLYKNSDKTILENNNNFRFFHPLAYEHYMAIKSLVDLTETIPNNNKLKNNCNKI